MLNCSMVKDYVPTVFLLHVPFITFSAHFYIRQSTFTTSLQYKAVKYTAHTCDRFQHK